MPIQKKKKAPPAARQQELDEFRRLLCKMAALVDIIDNAPPDVDGAPPDAEPRENFHSA